MWCGARSRPLPGRRLDDAIARGRRFPEGHDRGCFLRLCVDRDRRADGGFDPSYHPSDRSAVARVPALRPRRHGLVRHHGGGAADRADDAGRRDGHFAARCLHVRGLSLLHGACVGGYDGGTGRAFVRRHAVDHPGARRAVPNRASDHPPVRRHRRRHCRRRHGARRA